jgi:hypothetical protein
MYKKFWSQILEGRDCCEELAIDKTILKLISKKQGARMWTGFI